MKCGGTWFIVGMKCGDACCYWGVLVHVLMKCGEACYYEEGCYLIANCVTCLFIINFVTISNPSQFFFFQLSFLSFLFISEFLCLLSITNFIIEIRSLT